MMPLDFYRQFMGPDDVVFDIGACVGEHSRIFAQLASSVISVEPICSQPALPVNVTWLSAALSNVPGAEIMLYSSAKSLGSCNFQWIKAVKKSNRFGNEDAWNLATSVPALTLDSLIHKYGYPSFIKIDVEGSELAVLRGLSESVRALSFEFTPECWDEMVACMERCYALGMKEFNYSVMQSYELGQWTNVTSILERMRPYRDVITTYGDVYARA